MVGLVLLGLVLSIVLVMVVQAVWVDRRTGYDVYVIKRGRHYSRKSNFFLPLPFEVVLAPKVLRFGAIFGDGTATPGSNDDINKLYGMTFGFDPRYRSVRIGWRACRDVPETLELFAYWHDNSTLHYAPLGRVAQYEEVFFTILHTGAAVAVGWRVTEAGPDTVCYLKMSGASSWLRFRLYPYFGGTDVAPCDMKIYVRNL